MKKILSILLLLPLAVMSQVGINTTAPKAALDIESTNNGVLIPRVQLTSILDVATVVNPNLGALETSTIVYNIGNAGVVPNNVVPGFYYWNNSAVPAQWIPVARGTNWNLYGNTAITTPANPATYGTSTFGATENYLGTTDNNDVTVGTNSIERMRVKNTTGNVGIGLSNPTEKLHVFQITNADKSSVFSEAGQISSSIDYQNTAIKGFGKGSGPSLYGFGNGIMGIGDVANSYYATGIYAHLGSTTPLLPITNQAFYANGNNIGSAGIFMGGNVGIGIVSPTEKLHVFTNSDTNKSSIFGYAQQTTGAADFQNIAVKGFGTGIPGFGFGNGVMGIANMTNSYRATGVYAGLDATTPLLPITNQALFANGNGDGNVGTVYGVFSQATGTNNAVGTRIAGYFNAAGSLNNYAIIVPINAGRVGIGTSSPSNLLHVNSATAGAVRIVDGTQGNGKVLTSNATGVGTWQAVGIDNVVGVLSASGVSIPYTQTGNFLQTGSYITLPPGKYGVNVTMLLARNTSTLPSPNNSFFWVRSTFSDSAGINPLSSPDIIGSTLASGNFGGTSVYAMLIGTIIINNTSGANKTYHYVAGRTETANTSETVTNIGSSYWFEDNIIAYRLN